MISGSAGLTVSIAVNAFMAVAALQAQMVTNPGFEQLDAGGDPVGWTETGGFADSDPSNNATIYTPPTFGLQQAFEGAHVYGVVKDGSRLGGTIFQQVSGVTPGTRYRASVWLYTLRLGDGEMRGSIAIDPTGGTDPQSTWVVASVPVHSDGHWTRLEVDAVAIVSTITIFATLLQSGSTGFAINYVDSVELIANPPLTTNCGDGTGVVTLDDRRVDFQEQTEAQYTVPEGYVITGIGARGSDENISTMLVREQPLLADGDLGESRIVRFGFEPDGPIEAAIMLPSCYLAVGYGARAVPEFDIATLAIWARPVLPDGSLGPMEEFRAGREPGGGLERHFIVEDGRALTGVGLRMQFSDLTGMYVASDRYTRDEAGIPGDFDGDRDVDLEDFGRFQACYSGPGVSQALPECAEALLDGDADVDQDDLLVFLRCMTGANIPGDVDCR